MKIVIKIDDFEYEATFSPEEVEGPGGAFECYDIARETAWYFYKRKQEGYIDERTQTKL